MAQQGPTRSSEARRGRWVAGASWAYAALVLAVLALMGWEGERWWPATVLLFLPRGVWLAPLVVLVPAAAGVRRWRLWPLQAAVALVVLGPVMGFSVPWERLRVGRSAGTRVRVMTFNHGTGPIDAEGLIRLVEREGIQLICFQEVEETRDPRLEAYLARGWFRDSRRTIASRWPIVGEVDPGTLPSREGTYWGVRLHRVRVRAPSGAEFLVAGVHMPTMMYAFRALAAGDVGRFRRHVAWRWEQVAYLRDRLDESGDLPILIGGDFNMPPDSPMLQALVAGRLRLGFEDAGWGYGYTRPGRLPWIRIDHLLATPDWAFDRCWVGPDLGSDHRPLIADVLLK